MKSCPLCAAKAADGAATCFECLYSFASMSARTSTLADTKTESHLLSGPHEGEDQAIAEADRCGATVDVASDRTLALVLSDTNGRRVVVRSRRGSILAMSQPHSGEASRRRVPELQWYRSGATVFVEPRGDRCSATLNGMPLLRAIEVTSNDVVSLGNTLMSARV